jgi:hypothetical protein
MPVLHAGFKAAKDLSFAALCFVFGILAMRMLAIS